MCSSDLWIRMTIPNSSGSRKNTVLTGVVNKRSCPDHFGQLFLLPFLFQVGIVLTIASHAECKEAGTVCKLSWGVNNAFGGTS